MDSPQSRDARWFAAEVAPHETSLRSYLRTAFPTVRDVDDVVQNSYLRIWRRSSVRPIQSAKAFLFTVARRLALDLVRRNRRSPLQSVGDWGALDVMDDGTSVTGSVSRAERVQLLIHAIEALPARCREVVILRRLKFLSQREVAARLGISENGVEVQLTRGLARCRRFLEERGVHSFFDE
jgi:RNA polymerase sigma-70 factor (ECF subfamily)